MVQFGINGDPKVSSDWRTKTIMDEPVKVIAVRPPARPAHPHKHRNAWHWRPALQVSNKPGYITFAKTGAPNSRTTQLFINYVDNARLDGMGFAPFGEVEGDGMAVVKKVPP